MSGRYTYHRGSVAYAYGAPEATKRWEQACRQRWRALALVIKAKLEAVGSGISVFEEEFLANIVMPDGSTFGAYALPQIEHIYETRELPALLPWLDQDGPKLLGGAAR